MIKKFFILFLILFTGIKIFGQFGQNKVNYKDFDWLFIQTKHFDIYYVKGSETIAEFTAAESEKALTKTQADINYQINNRISLIVYNSHNDFQETNTTDEYLPRGVGGFTEPFKNRVVFPFEGSYKKFQHVIAHELVHAVMRDMYYGGSIQNIVARGITLQLPTWFWEGTAEYLSQGWETNTDMFIRNAIMSDALPDIDKLDGYLAYRGGQSLFRFIADTYGRQKIGDIMAKIQSLGGLEQGIKAALGISLEELNERWKKSVKKQFWPDIKDLVDPDVFAKRLTDNKKIGGSYNTSPAISPQGDKIAFISDRDIYLDVYIMDAIEGKVIKKIVESGTTTDFEELNLLHPSIAWAPDNKRIALSSKSGGHDVITIINTETEQRSELPVMMSSIESMTWSRDGDKIAFVGQNERQTDIFLYDFKSQQVTNLTNDIFSDNDPAFTPNGKQIIFNSDRGEFVDVSKLPANFAITNHNYKQLDLYSINLETKKIERLTDWKFSDEKFPAVSEDGKEIIFISDKNGINNIYRMKIKDGKQNSPSASITNSISEIVQPSISADGKKIVFAALYNLGYNIFLIDNPFETKIESDSLRYTDYMKEVINPKTNAAKEEIATVVKKIESENSYVPIIDSTSIQTPEIFVGQYVSNKVEVSDTAKTDFSKYVFADTKVESDSEKIAKRNLLFTESLDRNGNFAVNKYKINFTPDLVYANAGFSTLYGLLGTTVLSFSDMLGNHRLIGQTSMQIDIKNSDYGLAYFYLKERMDWGIQGFHTARFLYRSTSIGDNLYRYRNFGLILSASYPFSRFDRFDFGLSYLRVSSENLDDINDPIDENSFTIPTISYVHDNVMGGYTSPIEGTRYFLTFFGDPGFIKSAQSFFSLTADYRKYFRFLYDNSFAFRFSGGYSGGGNPQRFFIGGTDNWINRTFKTGGVPISSSSDFAFLSPALPMRGYDYAERIGTKYALMNLELRMPIIRYLVTGGLPIFFQNILGVAFLDAGSAWDNTAKLKLIGTNEAGTKVTQDLLLGTGVGFRVAFLFLWRIDIAWNYNLDKWSAPKYYISLGLDF